MVGNPVDYDKKYNDNSRMWGKSNLDMVLKKYLKLLEGKNVLDLGIGEGQNSIVLSELGYNVTGVDYSIKSLEICKSNSFNIKLIQDDIRNFNIEKDKYNLIMSSYVLHFLHKNDVYNIIKNIKANIKQNGLIYISVFSINDPSLYRKENSNNFDKLDNNIFHKKSDDTYTSYFSKYEILEFFSDFTTILITDEYSMDLAHGKPHYHGIIKYIGRKGIS